MHWIRAIVSLTMAIAIFVGLDGTSTAQQSDRTNVLAGPANIAFPAIGGEIQKDLASPLPLQSDWAIKGWVRFAGDDRFPTVVAALEDQAGESLLELTVAQGRLVIYDHESEILSASRLVPDTWQLVTVSQANGLLTVQIDDNKPRSHKIQLDGEVSVLVLRPTRDGYRSFVGKLAQFTLLAATGQGVAQLDWSKPVDELTLFENASPSWPLQTKQYMGLEKPQDPATLPTSRAPLANNSLAVTPKREAALTEVSEGTWKLGDWKFIAAPETNHSANEISTPGFDGKGWLVATVPGTVLTSYVDNGVYPDPAFGLNNLLVPELLNQQDYWYRTEFVLPEGRDRSEAAVLFGGINYASEIWINGARVGTTAGAFTRGRFALPPDVTAGEKVAIAVRVSPPPNPGIPHEESLTAGAGKNGGAMTIDGPSFMASEGWDWIPGVRDRNTGIWQAVMLETTGSIRLDDPHVSTVLPRADNSVAELTFELPITNISNVAKTVTVSAQFDDVSLSKQTEIAANSTLAIRFTPVDYPELRIEKPQLWWPNGYGDPVLHTLFLSASADGVISDTRELRFGIREVSYDLSLVDAAETLQRVGVAPARGAGEQLIDVRHRSIRKVDGGWAVSLARDIDNTPALTQVPDASLAPHLLIRVNGVPIAVRGGNWGMDDWRKRVSRERMEPYFRLHRDAHVNTIRNWVGQNTAPVFFELADEYGLLVISDFWVSTQNHNGEPGDTALFLQNTRDKILRYRHHPSIVLWIGRNEGVPPPVLNEAFERLTRQLDGTRAYLPNSRGVNMSGSGPWNFQPPEAYFTRLARGFSTEIGTPSFPTLETFKTMMAEEDLWPISDAWAYHDWHQGGAGGVAPFMKAMRNRLGEPTNLEDFEKKAQLLQYDAHRAIFEGMNAGLFTQNSGRLLWMTHPAWPSTAWQIYSHDYDTQASYFGTKKGMEPVHVQLNLPNMQIAVVNSLGTPLTGIEVRIRNFDQRGILLEDRTIELDAAPFATTEGGQAISEALHDAHPLVFTKLELFDAAGKLLSDNFYWLGRDYTAYRALNNLAPAQVLISARQSSLGGEIRTEATLTNASAHPALMVKMSLLDDAGKRVLPAYWSDNYVSLLPGERRTITVTTPQHVLTPKTIAVGGWNIQDTATEVLPQIQPEG